MRDRLPLVWLSFFGVIAALLSSSIYSAANLPYPPDLQIPAWPYWAVFVSIMYTCNAFLCYLASSIRAVATRKQGSHAE